MGAFSCRRKTMPTGPTMSSGASRLLLRKISGKLLVIWDGAPIHRGQAIKAFLARGAAKRLYLEQLPSYAPDTLPG